MMRAASSPSSRATALIGRPGGYGGIAMTLGSASCCGSRPLARAVSVFDIVWHLVRGGGSRVQLHELTSGLESYTSRIVSARDRIELPLQQCPQQYDAAVRLHEMLFGVECDRALADLSLIVTGKPLMLLLAQLCPEPAVEARANGLQVPWR